MGDLYLHSCELSEPYETIYYNLSLVGLASFAISLLSLFRISINRGRKIRATPCIEYINAPNTTVSSAYTQLEKKYNAHEAHLRFILSTTLFCRCAPVLVGDYSRMKFRSLPIFTLLLTRGFCASFPKPKNVTATNGTTVRDGITYNADGSPRLHWTPIGRICYIAFLCSIVAAVFIGICICDSSDKRKKRKARITPSIHYITAPDAKAKEVYQKLRDKFWVHDSHLRSVQKKLYYPIYMVTTNSENWRQMLILMDEIKLDYERCHHFFLEKEYADSVASKFPIGKWCDMSVQFGQHATTMDNLARKIDELEELKRASEKTEEWNWITRKYWELACY